MRRLARLALVLAALVAAAGQAAAFMVYPDRDNPQALVVLIEKPYGEAVQFRMLPKPFDTVVQMAQGTDGLTFRWRYGFDPQHGMAFLTVDEDGLGMMHFEFWQDPPAEDDAAAEGDTLAAAAMLTDADGKPLHVFFAHATLEKEAASKVHVARQRMERPAAWWQRVAGVTFFNMKYFALQALEEDEVWVAMERAVDHVAAGGGTRQRALARPHQGTPGALAR